MRVRSEVKKSYFLVLIGMLVCTLFFQGSPEPAMAQSQSESVMLPEMLVIGSRRQVRSVSDIPTPVDVIQGEEFTDQGTGDVSNALRNLVPSYNVGTQPISDAATFIRPANLRGLAPDQTLVFVNGKRRHRGAVISFLGNGVSDASQGTDISVIPAIAIKRVEVLRDSASAQYGSDAIAGAINFVLKDSSEGGIVETQWGQTYEGDGEEYRFATNVGVPVTESGFLNLSAEYRNAEPTVRSVQRDDAAALIANGNTHVRQPYAQIWGAPDVDGDKKLFLNFGMDFGDQSTFYAFGNLAERRVEGGFFFRNPETRSGVNVDSNRNPLEYTLPSGEIFRWADVFPGGFTPQFGGKISDKAVTSGFRGSFDSGLTYDTSYTVGQSRGDFSIRDTINASLGPDSPTQFELGSYIQTEHTVNADLTYPVEFPGLSSELFAAAGVEWRKEVFRVRQGQRESWEIGPLAEAGFGIGANGFSGFSDKVAGEWDRSNIALYTDIETDLLPRLSLDVMGRWEKFDDFGSTTNGKLAALFRVTPGLSLRGSASTGFRVPTVGQENINNVTTAFLDGQLRQRGTIPATCPEAVSKGAKPLEPEESVTFAAGIVGESGPFSITADYFNIKITDRIGQSGDKTLTQPLPNGCFEAADVLLFSYFGNGFDTRTQGVDIIGTVDITQMMPSQGRTELIFVGSYANTEVIDYETEFLDEKRILQLEEALPDYRFNLTLQHQQSKWSGLLRLNYFGPYTETHVDQLNRLIDAGRELTLDFEASYVVMNSVEFTVGAENMFNNFPTDNPHSGFVGSKYPESSPMGVAGGFYYGRLRYLF